MVLDKNGWIIMLVYSLSQGLVQMWQSSMVINLTSPDRSQRVSETFANYLGVSISFVSVAVSISIATMMDYFRKKMKLARPVTLKRLAVQEIPLANWKAMEKPMRMTPR